MFQIGGHVLNMLLPECEETCLIGVVPVVLEGIAFTIIYPLGFGIIPFVTGEDLIGTGFGIAGAITNYADFLSPLIGSAIHDNTLDTRYGYYWVKILIALIILVTVLLDLLLMCCTVPLDITCI